MTLLPTFTWILRKGDASTQFWKEPLLCKPCRELQTLYYRHLSRFLLSVCFTMPVQDIYDSVTQQEKTDHEIMINIEVIDKSCWISSEVLLSVWWSKCQADQSVGTITITITINFRKKIFKRKNKPKDWKAKKGRQILESWNLGEGKNRGRVPMLLQFCPAVPC